MKIGIITIVDGQNYGNRLQNYALQNVMEKMGHEVETLRRHTYKDLSGISKLKKHIQDSVKFFCEK